MRRCSSEIPNTIPSYLRHLSVSMLVVGMLCGVAQAGKESEHHQHFKSITGKKGSPRQAWDRRYSTSRYIYGKKPAAFVVEVLPQLKVGRVLDIAMGEGRNAVYLAKKGFQVEGVDISEVALRKARRLAKQSHVTIQTISADLTKYEIKPNSYDVIVNINYLQRSLVPHIKSGLKSKGWVVFETFTREHLKTTSGQGFNPDYLLEMGELKRLFSDFKVHIYREKNDGHEATASLLAQKP